MNEIFVGQKKRQYIFLFAIFTIQIKDPLNF